MTGVGGMTEVSLQFGQVSNGPLYSRAMVIFLLKSSLARATLLPSPVTWNFSEIAAVSQSGF